MTKRKVQSVRKYSNFGPTKSKLDRYSELGTTGLRQWSGSIHEERLRELRGREGRILLREMRMNDPVISAIFFALVNSLKQATWRVKPFSESSADKECADFVESCLVDLNWSWSDQLTFAIEPTLEQGFSLLEIVFKKRLGDNPPNYIENPAASQFNDGRTGWRKLAPRPAETLAPGSEWIFDDNGGIQGIVQQPEVNFSSLGFTPIFIPIERLLHFRTTVHPANNPEGVPVHRAMYVPYYYSKNIMEVEGIGLERDVAGIPIAYMGDDSSKSADDPNSDFKMLSDLVTNIRMDDQIGVVVPAKKMGIGMSDNNGILIELLSTGGARQYNTTEILSRYDKLKAVSVLAQFIMLGMTQVGSFALSKHQGDLFVIAASSFLYHIADTFNRHGIPKLIKMNVFPDIKGMPTLQPSTIGIPDLKTISDYVNTLVGSEVLTPDPELERHLRQIADLPQASVDIQKRKKRSLEDVTEVVRRAALASRTLEQLGVMDENEVTTLLRPMVNEVRSAIEAEGFTIEKSEVEAMIGKYRVENITTRNAQVWQTISAVHEKDLKSGLVSRRLARLQLLAAGYLTQDQFESEELTDGRLPDGQDTVDLFYSSDSFYQEVLDLNVSDPTNVPDNDPEEMILEITAATDNAKERLFVETNEENKKKLEYAIAALDSLNQQYQDVLAEEVTEEAIAENNNQAQSDSSSSQDLPSEEEK